MRRNAFAFLLGFLGTAGALRWWAEASYPSWLWVSLGVAAFLGFMLSCVRRTRRLGAPLVAGAVGIALAFWAVQRTTHVPTESDIDWHADGTQQIVTGRVVDRDLREMTIKYTLEALTTQKDDRTIHVHGKMLLTDAALWPKPRYGDIVQAKGKLERPEEFDGFRYDEYLSAFGTYAIMYSRSLQILQPAEGWSLRGTLLDWRVGVSGRIGIILPEPHAAMLDGLLTGNRASVPQEVLSNFTTVGMTHMLAISGFNISIVIAVLSSLLFFLPVRWRLLPSIAAVTLFTIFVGASASVVRAAIMGILGLLSLHTGRVRDARLAVLWTAFFMLVFNPRSLWFDASFQLSFLSVMGLIELQPFMTRMLRRVPEILGLRESLALTLAAQVFAAPWSAMLFGSVSLISPLSNLLAAPLIPLAMLCGTLALVFSTVFFSLGQLFGVGAWLCIEGMLRVAQWTSSVPLASISIPSTPWWLLVLYYVALIAILKRLASNDTNT